MNGQQKEPASTGVFVIISTCFVTAQCRFFHSTCAFNALDNLMK